MRELEAVQSHARTTRPIHHVHADTPVGLTPDREEAVRAHFWRLYEAEFGLEAAPFFSRIHIKSGRVHEHHVYGLGRSDGSVVSLSFDMQRREKVSRQTEIECGLPLTAGAHNRAVIAAFEQEGKHHLAAAMRSAGLHEIQRPRASITPGQRAQQERTGVGRSSLSAIVSENWSMALDGVDFAAALTRSGLMLAKGRDCLVVVDQARSVHGLSGLIADGARSAGRSASTAAEVGQFLVGTDIPDLDAARQRRPQQAGEVRAPASTFRAGQRRRAVIGIGRVPAAVVAERPTRQHVSHGPRAVVVSNEAAIARRLEAGSVVSGLRQAAARKRHRLARAAAAPTQPPTFEATAVARLEAAISRAEHFLSLAPYADSASRDRRAIESSLRDEALARELAAGRTAELAREQAALARANLSAGARFITAIRLPTGAATELARLEREAARLTIVAETESAVTAQALQDARQRASTICGERIRKRRAWWARPEVVRAAEELRLDERALRAVHDGDAALAKVIAVDGLLAGRSSIRGHGQTSPQSARSDQTRDSEPGPGPLLRAT